MRPRYILLPVLWALLAGAAAQAQTTLMTYEGIWAEALEAALKQGDDLPAINIVRYDGSLAALSGGGADLLDAETGAANVVCDQGPALPLPPDFWDGAVAEMDLLAGTAHDCGTGYLVTSLLLASADGGPRDWAEFFDAATYSGTRALPRGARGTLEIALMGDGVPPGEVHALLATEDGTARALAALDALAGDAQIVFWDRPGDVTAMMGAGAVAAAAVPNVQAAVLARDLAQSGAPVTLHFSGQIYRIQRLLLLAGASGQSDALRVMRHVLAPDTQATLARSLMAGPVNAAAFDQLTAAEAALLPTAPVHRITETGLAEQADFWAQHGTRLTLRFHDWLAAYEGAGQ